MFDQPKIQVQFTVCVYVRTFVHCYSIEGERRDSTWVEQSESDSDSNCKAKYNWARERLLVTRISEGKVHKWRDIKWKMKWIAKGKTWMNVSERANGSVRQKLEKTEKKQKHRHEKEGKVNLKRAHSVKRKNKIEVEWVREREEYE